MTNPFGHRPKFHHWPNDEQSTSPLDVPGRPAAVRSTIGAGDVLTGVLLARLANSGYYPSAVGAALPDAVVQSSLACERWGALE